VLRAKICQDQLIKMWSSEGAICYETQHLIFDISANQIDPAFGRDPVDSARAIRGDVKISGGVKGQPVRDRGEALRISLRNARSPIRPNLDSENPIQIALDDVKVLLICIES
jgi:hypothetical protein